LKKWPTVIIRLPKDCRWRYSMQWRRVREREVV
jgi:hypothetical protein